MRLVLVALAAFFAFAFVPAAAAQKPGPLNLSGGGGFTQYDGTLERYNAYYYDPATGSSYVYPDEALTNPSPECTWDINDHLDRSAGGYLNPGGSSSVGQCMIAPINPIFHCTSIGAPGGDDGCYWWSGSSNWFGARVYSTSPGLTVTACYSPQLRCFAANVAYDATYRMYTYPVCVQAVYGQNDPAVIVIPGSTPDPVPYGASPGYGVRTTVTLTVANPTGRQVKGIGAYWGVSSDISFPQGCPQAFNGANGSDVPKQADYPFRWVVQ